MTRLVTLFCLALLALAGPAAFAGAPDFTTWLTNVPGMLEAAQEYEKGEKPIFVYFYTDWCGYCRQFERELLGSDEVADYMSSILAVRVNPESGRGEAELGRRYGVSSFPALFVHSSESKTITRVQRMEMVDGRPKLLSPDAFIDMIKQAGAH